MSCVSQNFRLFHVSNLSVRNFRIFLLMYTGSQAGDTSSVGKRHNDVSRQSEGNDDSTRHQWLFTAQAKDWRLFRKIEITETEEITVFSVSAFTLHSSVFR